MQIDSFRNKQGIGAYQEVNMSEENLTRIIIACVLAVTFLFTVVGVNTLFAKHTTAIKETVQAVTGNYSCVVKPSD